MLRFPLCLLLLAAGGRAAPGALQWTTTDIALKTAVGQEEAVAVFPFRNTGDRPVRFISVEPSCSCLTADPDKEVYAPGEAGEIRTVASLTGFVGHLRRAIAVETDDAAARFAELTLTLDIPDPVVISPRFLLWPVGGHPEEESLEIVLADPAKSKLGDAECQPPVFNVRLIPGEAGRSRLFVKPADTQRPAEATIRLTVTIADRPQSYVIYVAVR